MKKRWMILTAAFLVMALPLSARAEDYTGGEGWQVTYTGKKLESNFDYAEVADLAQGMQPGDRMTMEIAVRNGEGQKADWYLSNEVLKTFEETDGTSAAGGAYTYVLTYADGSGEKELYSSSRVGGEKTDGTASEGLHEATEGLEEYMYLGRLEGSDAGKLRLEIVLDGETQGNDYARTLASLKINFAVEEVSGGGTGGGTAESGEDSANAVKEKIVKTVKQQASKGVKTGDYSSTVLWTSAALVSGFLLILLGILRLRRDKGGDEDER